MRSPPREYPLPARLIPGVFPFVNKQLSRVKKKKKKKSAAYLALRSFDSLLYRTLCYPQKSGLVTAGHFIRMTVTGGGGEHCRFDVCPRGKKGAKTPDECMLFFRSDDKM